MVAQPRKGLADYNEPQPTLVPPSWVAQTSHLSFPVYNKDIALASGSNGAGWDKAERGGFGGDALRPLSCPPQLSAREKVKVGHGPVA